MRVRRSMRTLIWAEKLRKTRMVTYWKAEINGTAERRMSKTDDGPTGLPKSPPFGD